MRKQEQLVSPASQKPERYLAEMENLSVMDLLGMIPVQI